jgi:cytochrome c peroxidase
MFNVTRFWDERAPTLEEQAKLPILNPVEMGQKAPEDVVAKLNGIPQYTDAFQKVFNRAPNYDDMAKAIAAYERTQVTFDTPFDRFMAGDGKAIDASARLDDLQRQGPLHDGIGGYRKCRRISPADVETAKFIEEGKEIFHNPDKLGGTIGVSCDMCHPDAANTHRETYPKFRTQLQRVALLRDMINWCIENPVKGKPLSPDDPRQRALEAYIIAQRNGTALAYGKH